jgi:AcrR family transcriptional regulator
MPRGFSEQERSIIREKLLLAGQELLIRQGVRKVRVDDLVQTVGISKGAFYAFFDSKEALFFALFRQYEEAYQADLLALSPGQPAMHASWLRDFFLRAISHWHTSPLFQHFTETDYAYLTRKLPHEINQAMLETDYLFAERLLQHWATHGLILTCDTATFTGLMRALFFVALNSSGIGQNAPLVLNILIDGLIARILVLR